MGVLKKYNLKWLFFSFLMSILVGYFVLAVVTIGGQYILVVKGIIRPADYVEKQIYQYHELYSDNAIAKVEHLPEDSTYAVVEQTTMSLLESNMSDDELGKALSFLQTGIRSSNDQIYRIKDEGKVLLIHYPMHITTSSPRINAYLPWNIDWILLIAWIGVFLIYTLLVVIFYANKMNKEFRQLIEVTSEIKEQNLDFKVATSIINEFNTVLGAMDELRMALKQSLETQWESEANKRKQISGLAHDIKTPLTIIRGNADLLQEELNEEDQLLTDYILKNTKRIEEYLAVLMEVSCGMDGIKPIREEVQLNTYFNQLKEEIEYLGQEKEIVFNWRVEELKTYPIDAKLIHRVMTNIIQNAIRFSPNGGKIQVHIRRVDENIQVIVYDEGPGFSSKALHHGKEEFFMEDSSRHGGKHYGLGLYICNQIMVAHRGRLSLENWEKGAKVVVIF